MLRSKIFYTIISYHKKLTKQNMCPLYPIHLLLTYAFLICVLWAVTAQSIITAFETHIPTRVRLFFNDTAVEFIELTEKETQEYTFYLEDLPPGSFANVIIQDAGDDGLNHLKLDPQTIELRDSENPLSSSPMKEGKFNATGVLLGFSKVRFHVSTGDDGELMEIPPVNAKIHRGRRTLDIIFIHVLIGLILIAYVNMGCALDLSVVQSTLRRPIGPVIGLLSQYLFMPLLSFSLGYALFRHSPELWLGLFLTGCAPGGGGSNLWTYILKGSLDLSVTMTFISTVAAFGMLPLWVFALGRVIFAGGHFTDLPYRSIITLIVALLVPCGIGVLIRRCRPRVADILTKCLKPISIIFIIFVMTFGVYANLYMFSFFSWQVVVGAFLLPFFGYLFGGVSALVCRQEWPAVTAISIETGIQNTGLAIGVIKVALHDYSPLDDISMVMPVAVATMTPIPLIIAYILQRAFKKPLKEKVPFAIPSDESTEIFVGSGYTPQV